MLTAIIAPADGIVALTETDGGKGPNHINCMSGKAITDTAQLTIFRGSLIR